MCQAGSQSASQVGDDDVDSAVRIVCMMMAWVVAMVMIMMGKFGPASKYWSERRRRMQTLILEEGSRTQNVNPSLEIQPIGAKRGPFMVNAQ